MKYLLSIWMMLICLNTSETIHRAGTCITNFTNSKEVYPKLMYADSIIDSSPINTNSIAWRLKNPGNLRSFKTGKYRSFKTLKEGYSALIHQLNLYTSGRSMWTDSTTTLEEYVNIYASEARSKDVYINVLSNGLNICRSSKVSSINVDSLAKYHIKMEDVELYKIIYEASFRY